MLGRTAAWIFQQYLEETSDAVEVSLYPNNALRQEREAYEGMQLGSGASCAFSGTAIFGNFNRDAQTATHDKRGRRR